jgi:hypothetical protein
MVRLNRERSFSFWRYRMCLTYLLSHHWQKAIRNHIYFTYDFHCFLRISLHPYLRSLLGHDDILTTYNWPSTGWQTSLVHKRRLLFSFDCHGLNYNFTSIGCHRVLYVLRLGEKQETTMVQEPHKDHSLDFYNCFYFVFKTQTRQIYWNHWSAINDSSSIYSATPFSFQIVCNHTVSKSKRFINCNLWHFNNVLLYI